MKFSFFCNPLNMQSQYLFNTLLPTINGICLFIFVETAFIFSRTPEPLERSQLDSMSCLLRSNGVDPDNFLFVDHSSCPDLQQKLTKNVFLVDIQKKNTCFELEIYVMYMMSKNAFYELFYDTIWIIMLFTVGL